MSQEDSRGEKAPYWSASLPGLGSCVVRCFPGPPPSPVDWSSMDISWGGWLSIQWGGGWGAARTGRCESMGRKQISSNVQKPGLGSKHQSRAEAVGKI